MILFCSCEVTKKKKSSSSLVIIIIIILRNGLSRCLGLFEFEGVSVVTRKKVWHLQIFLKIPFWANFACCVTTVSALLPSTPRRLTHSLFLSSLPFCLHDQGYTLHLFQAGWISACGVGVVRGVSMKLLTVRLSQSETVLHKTGQHVAHTSPVQSSLVGSLQEASPPLTAPWC